MSLSVFAPLIQAGELRLPEASKFGHDHFWERAFSRRQVLRGGIIGGALMAGGALVRPALAQTSGRAPKPIPSGFAGPAGPKVYSPEEGVEPNVFTDFHGIVGVSHVQGPGVAYQDGVSLDQVYFDTDMRFMKGEYVAVNGRRYIDTFAFIWLDVFLGPVGSMAQIHDYNPGYEYNGLFWTVPVSPKTFSVDAKTGHAVFRMKNYAIPDYHNFFYTLTPRPQSTYGRVSFEIRWEGGGKVVKTATDGETFRYKYRTGRTTSRWVGETPSENFRFESAGHAESISLFGAVGEEWNGLYFKP